MSSMNNTPELQIYDLKIEIIAVNDLKPDCSHKGTLW